ncbi:MAG: DUF695 domain-containing protein [Alphaproteobacteria bacterium]|nr:DUF695 domain-containing protein [Alphaproteobacteria bacterium]
MTSGVWWFIRRWLPLRKANERWESYFSRINDQVGSIFVNMALEKGLPSAGRDHLVQLRVTARALGPNGFPSAGDLDKFAAQMKAIQTEINRVGGAIYVGHITYGGLRESFWYAQKPSSVEDAVRRGMRTFQDYDFMLSSRPEPNWETYRNVLLPSPHERRLLDNSGVYDALRKEGDALDEAREVDHWAYFPTADARNEFVKRLPSGYALRGTTNPNHTPAHTDYGARVFHTSVPGDELDAATIELFDLAKETGGEYDGWECPIVKTR